MIYTLKVNELSKVLHPGCTIDGSSLEVIAVDEHTLNICGELITVHVDSRWCYRVNGDGSISSSINAKDWIKELKKDMEDPSRFWSETYFNVLLSAGNKTIKHQHKKGIRK